MGAYQNPGFDPAGSLMKGAQVMSQIQIDNARRAEIAAKAAAQYGGVANTGQMNPISLSQPLVTPDAGYTPRDQGQAQRLGRTLTPPPVQPAPAQNLRAAAMVQPQMPVQQSEMPAGAPDLPPLPEETSAEMPAPPPTLDMTALQSFRGQLRGALGQYNALTREKMRAQGLEDRDIDELRGLGPVSQELQNKLMELGTAQLPQYATGTDTPDFIRNRDLEGMAALQRRAETPRGGSKPTVFKSDFRQGLQQEALRAMDPLSGILDPALQAATQRELSLYDQAFAGTLTQEPTDPNDRAIVIRARAEANLAKQLSGLTMGGGALAAPAPRSKGIPDLPSTFRGTELERAWTKLPPQIQQELRQNSKKDINALIGKVKQLAPDAF